MPGIKLFEKLEDFGNQFITLINSHLKYYKITAYEQVMTVVSILISKTIILFTGVLASLFASVWLAFFIGELLGKLSLGFLAVSAVYILAGFIIHRNRHAWIIDPFIAEISKAIEKQEILENDEGSE